MLKMSTVRALGEKKWFPVEGLNGTTVNGRAVAETVELRDGDTIGFGTVRFSFRRN